MQQIEYLLDQADYLLQNKRISAKNWRNALKIYTLAAKMGSGIAYKRIGDLYLDEKYKNNNLRMALLNYDKSIEFGYLAAYSDKAIVYALLESYHGTIHNWEKYFAFVDAEDIQDTCLAAKAIFYLLLKIRNNNLPNTYKCFLKVSDDMLKQVSEDSDGLTQSIGQKLHSLKILQRVKTIEEVKTLQLKLIEEIRDLEDLRKCNTIILCTLTQRKTKP